MNCIYTAYIGYDVPSIQAMDKIDHALRDYGIMGFTMLKAIGYWQGKQEESIQLIVVCENVLEASLKDALSRIARYLHQECILLTMTHNTLPISEVFIKQ